NVDFRPSNATLGSTSVSARTLSSVRVAAIQRSGNAATWRADPNASMALDRPGFSIDGEMLDMSSSARPRLRGVWHKWACVWSVPFGVALVLVANDARARVAVSIYAATLVGLFGVSALYHRVNWISISARRWMRRLDHSMIFMLIAGTYTPFALLALHGELARAIL